MAKCNLFKSVTNTNAFLTFSQWAEDLTIQNALGDAYRIVPSRFAVFYIDEDVDKIPDILLAKYEHKCAALRHFLSVDTTTTENFTPRDSSLLFWKALTDAQKLTVSSKFPELVYAGELDIQGTNYIDGTTYSEWYAIIPSDAKKMKNWEKGSSGSMESNSYNLSDAGAVAGLPFRWTTATIPSSGIASSEFANIGATVDYDVANTDFPAVFTCADNQTRYSSLNTLDSLHHRYMQDVLYSGNQFNYGTETSFDFNLIVLFYDIVAKDESNNYQYLYTAVPMGAYVMPTMMTHYVSSEDIYGQGTSYGLRVTTKFSAESLVSQTSSTPASVDGNPISTSASVEEVLPAMSAVMDRFNAAADTLNNFIQSEGSTTQDVLDHMNSYKDNRVNIPYIREIKEAGDTTPRKYWFVNGRSTGVPVYGDIHVTIDSATDVSTLTQILRDIINDYGDEIVGDTIDNSVHNYLNNNTPTLDPGDQTNRPYIEFVTTVNRPIQSVTSIPQDVSYIPNVMDLQDITNGVELFKDYSSLQRIPRLELSNCTDLSSAFQGCSSLTTACLENTVSCENFNNTFNGCSSLKTVCFDATSAKYMNSTFLGCTALKNIRIDNIDTSIIHSLDLHNTDCTFASLDYIVSHLQANSFDANFDNTTQNNSTSNYITIKVPDTISLSDPYISDMISLAGNNKSILLTITH